MVHRDPMLLYQHHLQIIQNILFLRRELLVQMEVMVQAVVAEEEAAVPVQNVQETGLVQMVVVVAVAEMVAVVVMAEMVAMAVVHRLDFIYITHQYQQ